MLRSGALIGLLCVTCCVGACDSGEEPKPVSTFPGEDPFARQLVGRVYQGTEVVEGALVRIDPASALAYDVQLAATSELPRVTSTDPTGFYRVQFAPFYYDLSVRHDQVLLVMRGVAGRLVLPQLGADAPVTGFHANMVPTTEPLPKAGNAVAYLVSGADARTIGGGPGSFDVTFRRFSTTITLHALEYVARDGLANVVRSGKVDVPVTSGVASAPVVPTSDRTTKKTVTFEATLPAGFSMASLELAVDAGLRTSQAPVANVSLGTPYEITLAPDVAYSVRGRATSGGAVSDSGRFVFDPNAGKVSLLFPGPVSAETPVDDDAPATGGLAPVTLEPGGVLAVRLGTGIVEHVLSPVIPGGPVVRIMTDARATTVPDVTQMGLPPPTGRYDWTFQHFPTLLHVEQLAGEDGRVALPSSRSGPKAVLFR